MGTEPYPDPLTPSPYPPIPRLYPPICPPYHAMASGVLSYGMMLLGACLDVGREFLIMQYFEYGSIRDMVHTPKYPSTKAPPDMVAAYLLRALDNVQKT
eukprot:50846-Rhodomonas_salina.1